MIGYWLIPAEPQRSVFVASIEELARKYDAPIFEPHLTLYSSDDDETLATSLVTRIAAREQPLRLAIHGIEHSAKFTKTLFVQFAANVDARRISDAFRDGSTSKQDCELNPHLSLLYAGVADETKAQEAGRIQLPFGVVTFDAVEAISFVPPITNRADVEAWRAIAKAKLGG